MRTRTYLPPPASGRRAGPHLDAFPRLPRIALPPTRSCQQQLRHKDPRLLLQARAHEPRPTRSRTERRPEFMRARISAAADVGCSAEDLRAERPYSCP